MTSLISIIIPTYNRAHLIGETLDSVLVQTYTNWECIIIDDGSSDNTLEIIDFFIKKDNRFQYHSRPKDRQKGANSCRNYGFELSKGEYIKWFDSDDILFPNAFEKLSLYFSNSCDSIVSSLEYVDFNKRKIEKKHNFISDNTIEDYLTGKITFYTFTPIWKRKFLEKQNELFDETISNLDDWDFNLRMLYQEPAIVYLNKPLIKYRVHEASLSQEINKLNFDEIKSEFRAREKHLKLIKTNGLVNSKVLKNYIRDRYKFLLREALIQNHDKKSYLLRMLLVTQLKISDFNGFIKSIFSFTIFSLFNKGYKFLK